MFGLGFDIERTLVWIVLLPLLGALINGVAGGRASKQLVSAVAVGSVFVSFLLSLIGFGALLTGDGAFEFLGVQGDGRQAFVQDLYEWFSINVGGTEVPIRARFMMDHLSGMMAVMVSGIAMLIHVYSTGYMAEDPGYARFMTYLNLFTASMLILVLASNLPLMFVGWEGVGLCSYLLIGFWYTNADYAAAGRKAFVVNRIGDFGVLIGMFLLVGTVADGGASDAFEFAQINAAAGRLDTTEVTFLQWTMPATVATVATLFIFLGCAGKSAQIPLYVWLPDAMAGPTPVSALIHAATMVTAGVYLCCRLSPIIAESQAAMAIIAIIGTLTAFLAASIALVQNQMKRVLAYSTVSQLGFMFAAVGMGAFGAGIFHVFTHAFFKACLFLGAGSVMHAVHAHGDADIRYLGGLAKWMPKTRWTFLISTAAIAGIPLLSGFFSKDEILLGAATWGAMAPSTWDGNLGIWDNITAGAWAGPWVGWFVLGMLVLTAGMTAFYMFRLYFRTFHGEFKGGHAPVEHGHAEPPHDEHAHEEHEPHESPDSMTIPLWVLAGGAAIVGFLGLPHAFHLPNAWGAWFESQSSGDFAYELRQVGARIEERLPDDMPQADAFAAERGLVTAVEYVGSPFVSAPRFVPEHVDLWIPLLAMILGILAALLGTGLAYMWYLPGEGRVPESIKNRMPGVHKFLMNKWYIDELYGVTIVALNKWFAVFAANFDRYFVDFLLTKLPAVVVKASGYAFTRAQTGAVYAYAAMFVLGLAGLGWWFMYPHPSLVGEPGVRTVTWSAGTGLGYRYRWEFGDPRGGEHEPEWTTESTVEHDYAGGAFWGMVAIFESPRDLFGADEIVLREDEGFEPVPVGPDQTIDSMNLPAEAADYPPAIAYRKVVRFDGQVPENLIPRAPERAEGEENEEEPEPPTLAIEVSLWEHDVENRTRRIWGPEEHEVVVGEGGSFSVLLGSDESLSAQRIGAIRQASRETASENDGVFVQLEVGGERVGQHTRLEESPRNVILFRINGSGLSDNDGIDDGMRTIEPGGSLTVGLARMTAAVRVRATVEVRNAFGNLGRSTEEVTLRVDPGAAQEQHAEVTP